MIHLDRNPADIDQNQKSNLILADDRLSSTAAHFPWDPHEHHSDATYALENDLHPLDFALAKNCPPSPPPPALDGSHEDKSSPLSPAPDSASPNHDAKDLPQGHPPPREEPPPFDKGDLDVPREGTLTPLTELSPAPELDDESDKKDEDDSTAGETAVEKDDPRYDDKRRGDPPRTKIINGISSSSSSRSTDGSPIRLLPSTSSSFHNFTADPVSSKAYMFAGPSHSRASSSEYITPPIMHTAHNMPPPNMAHTSSNAKVIRILELNAELFKVCMEFQLRGVQTSDPRFYQYCTRLQANIAWLAAAADQRHHHNQVQLPIMEPPVAVEFSPPRIQHLYSDLPTLFAKDILRRQINATANPHSHPSHLHLSPHHNSHPNHHASPSSNGNLKRNRPDDPSDLSATKRRDMGDGKMHGSTSSAAVSPNPMLTGGMPSIAVSGPGPGPGMHPGSSLASHLAGNASLGSGLRASPPNSFPGQTGVGVPGTPGLPQSPPMPTVSSSGMAHPPSASLSSAGGTGMPGMGGVGGMQGMPGGGIPGSAPGSHPTLPFGATEASIAANSRTRARELQIQHARDQQLRHHHHQQQQQQQQQAAQIQQMQATAAARHLPPTSTSAQGLQGQGVGGMGGGNMGGGMGGGNAGGPGGQPQQPQQPQQVPVQQLLQVLQMPAHPLMQHVLQNVPNFSALPQQQQLQKLHMVYQQLVAQRQQQAAAAQRNPQMAGMSQNPAMTGTLSNGVMTGGSGNGGGPSPVSPLGQQPPVMTQPQPQQMSSQQSPQNGMFPFGQGHAGGNSGMDPRMAGAGGPNFSQQMGGMNFNQQRQLSLLQQQQQQQQMRNVNGNMGMGVGVSAPGMMGSQQHATMYGMNPRMMGQVGGSSSSSQQQQQPQPQPHGGAGAGGGSPMAPPLNDTFPTLRSNSTIPGIARSTRSPSDGVHSPMTPRAPSRLSHHQQQASNEYQQQVMLQQQQQQQQHAQSPFNQNPNWAQQGGQAQMGGVGSMQVNGYPSIGGASMGSPNGVVGMGGGGFFAGAPSPSNQSWQHGGGGMVGMGMGGYPSYGGQSAMGGQRLADPTRSAGQMGGTPGPTQNMSPIGDGTGNGEYDIFNAYTNGQ